MCSKQPHVLSGLLQRLRREVKTPISFIAHDIKFLNKRLRKGQYFFTDIKQEGVILHDTGKLELAEARELSPKERKKLAEENFEYWFSGAEKYKKGFNFYLEEKDYREAY